MRKQFPYLFDFAALFPNGRIAVFVNGRHAYTIKVKPCNLITPDGRG